MPNFHPIYLLVGIDAAVIIRLVVYFKGKNAKKFSKNLEYGSARSCDNFPTFLSGITAIY